MEIESKEKARQRGVPFAINWSRQEVESEGKEESELKGDEHGGYGLIQSCCGSELLAWDVQYVCKRLKVRLNRIVDRVKEIDEALDV